jgi:DNA polymerase IV
VSTHGAERGRGPRSGEEAGVGASAGRTNSSILHVDMDAFFVAVELLDAPELRGRPVVVGGSGDRGVVAAASYEARSYGVHSAMPSTRARRLCPDAVFLPGRFARYAEVSEQVFAIFRSFTPLVEGISLDEAFLDVTGAQRLFGPAPEIGRQIRARVAAELGLTCSVGVAPVKFLAKLASEAAKPRASRNGPVPGEGVHVVEPGRELEFLHPLPVRALWGVGPATHERLRRLGVETIGDLADLPRETIVGAVGKAAGNHLHDLAHGVDPRPVVAEHRPKSIGHEETFAVDHFCLDTLGREVVRLSESVGQRLRKAEVTGRTISIKVRFHDFRTITRSLTVDPPVDAGVDIARAARTLLEKVDPAPGVRLLGVHVSNLAEGAPRQLSLDDLATDAQASGSWDEATAAVDDIRRRFGDAAIVPAALAGPAGIRVKQRGDQQWGPDQTQAPRDGQAE